MSPSAVHVAKGHACHAKLPQCHGGHGRPDPAQSHKCHACHAKRKSMSPSASPATQNASPCRQVPRMPRESAVQGAPSATRPTTARPATQDEGPCRQAQRLPRKMQVHVAKGHSKDSVCVWQRCVWKMLWDKEMFDRVVCERGSPQLATLSWHQPCLTEVTWRCIDAAATLQPCDGAIRPTSWLLLGNFWIGQPNDSCRGRCKFKLAWVSGIHALLDSAWFQPCLLMVLACCSNQASRLAEKHRYQNWRATASKQSRNLLAGRRSLVYFLFGRRRLFGTPTTSTLWAVRRDPISVWHTREVHLLTTLDCIGVTSFNQCICGRCGNQTDNHLSACQTSDTLSSAWGTLESCLSKPLQLCKWKPWELYQWEPVRFCCFGKLWNLALTFAFVYWEPALGPCWWEPLERIPACPGVEHFHKFHAGQGQPKPAEPAQVEGFLRSDEPQAILSPLAGSGSESSRSSSSSSSSSTSSSTSSSSSSSSSSRSIIVIFSSSSGSSISCRRKFRSQTSDNMQRWKSRGEKSQGGFSNDLGLWRFEK